MPETPLLYSQANHAFEAQTLGLSNISGYLGYLNQDLNTHSRWTSIIGHWKETLNAGSGMILPFVKKSVE